MCRMICHQFWSYMDGHILASVSSMRRKRRWYFMAFMSSRPTWPSTNRQQPESSDESSDPLGRDISHWLTWQNAGRPPKWSHRLASWLRKSTAAVADWCWAYFTDHSLTWPKPSCSFLFLNFHSRCCQTEPDCISQKITGSLRHINSYILGSVFILSMFPYDCPHSQYVQISLVLFQGAGDPSTSTPPPWVLCQTHRSPGHGRRAWPSPQLDQFGQPRNGQKNSWEIPIQTELFFEKMPLGAMSNSMKQGIMVDLSCNSAVSETTFNILARKIGRNKLRADACGPSAAFLQANTQHFPPRDQRGVVERNHSIPEIGDKGQRSHCGVTMKLNIFTSGTSMLVTAKCNFYVDRLVQAIYLADVLECRCSVANRRLILIPVHQQISPSNWTLKNS